jgi:hypothetical protein
MGRILLASTRILGEAMIEDGERDDRETIAAFEDTPLRRVIRALRGDPPATYALTRSAIARGLAVIYLSAFLVAANQAVPLIGEEGLLPASWYLDDLRFHFGSTFAAFLQRPSLFWISASDPAIGAVAWTGVVLSVAALVGVSHPALFFSLWLLQLSFVHVGQVFWGYGWETLLLEAGFLAIFLYPLRGVRPVSERARSPAAMIWLYRWLLFRVMFGAGLIKLRGDPCWTELTCLDFHFETQPIPNPLTPLFDGLPHWVLAGGVLFNHFVELIVPFMYFGPRRVRTFAGLATIAFQLVLVFSGNLSWLNWLTIFIALSCFDDDTLRRLVPRRLKWRDSATPDPSRLHRRVVLVLVVAVLMLSVVPTVNLFSTRQLMNASFDRLHLVNTYGAFGSINRVRHEVVLEGTHAAADAPDSEWRAYELPCKPGDVDVVPCVVSPYHRRLDWQLWFAALGDYEREPWIVRLCWLLLEGSDAPMPLFANDPFPDEPPRFIRARLFEYHLTGRFGPWYRREPVAEYLRPMSRDDPEVLEFLEAYGLKR